LVSEAKAIEPPAPATPTKPTLHYHAGPTELAKLTKPALLPATPLKLATTSNQRASICRLTAQWLLAAWLRPITFSRHRLFAAWRPTFYVIMAVEWSLLEQGQLNSPWDYAFAYDHMAFVPTHLSVETGTWQAQTLKWGGCACAALSIWSDWCAIPFALLWIRFMYVCGRSPPLFRDPSCSPMSPT
jgi:hypothetical protein